MRLGENGRQRFYFYIFVTPWLIGFVTFTLYPILASMFYSLTEYDAVNPLRIIGLDNYKNLFHDELFWRSIKATCYYTFLSVPTQLILSLLLALLLNQKLPLSGFFRTAMYMPSMVSGVVMSLLWLWIFNPDIGLLNYLLSLAGIKGPLWLLDENWAIPALIFMSLWSLGGGMVIFLAALQGVPSSLKDASLLDGANRWQQFRAITFPMISPIFLFQMIMGVIESFQVFTQAIIMTGNGGPHYATFFYVFYLYANAFKNFQMGYASAMAWLLLVAIMILTFIILKLSNKFVYYEGGQK